jgi:hypothetical protein
MRNSYTHKLVNASSLARRFWELTVIQPARVCSLGAQTELALFGGQYSKCVTPKITGKPTPNRVIFGNQFEAMPVELL